MEKVVAPVGFCLYSFLRADFVCLGVCVFDEVRGHGRTEDLGLLPIPVSWKALLALRLVRSEVYMRFSILTIPR